MPPTYRCHCQSHRCNLQEGGNQVTLRILKKHEQDDTFSRAEELRKNALDAQHAALTALDNAMSRSSVNVARETGIGESQTSTPRYKADFKRRLISDLSQWKDALTHLTHDLESIGLPRARCSPQDIHTSSAQCMAIKKASGEIAQRLHIVSQGSYRKEASIATLLNETRETLELLKARVEVVDRAWHDLKRAMEDDVAHAFDTSSRFKAPFGNAPPLIQVVSLMVVVCQVLLCLPRRGCQWLFSMCSYVIEMTAQQARSLLQTQGPGAMAHYFMNILSHFPRDVRTATKNFQLDGKSEIYAICPDCHSIHKPLGDREAPEYPQRCNAKRYGNRCGELLLRPKTVNGREIFVPIRPYVVFDFRDWLAGLLSRNGYEEHMDNAWKKLSAEVDQIDDIFQGSMIRQFKGPDGQTHFSQAGPDSQTGRYLFSMGCDFFNPLRNIANGKRVSVGVVAIVCLNLPIALRYSPENIFLGGIIPGPKEPSLDSINPYLTPFVDVFLQFWEGIRFTRTSKYPMGRWILSALIAIVCDLPAGRKVGGLSACSHEYFCSVCWCTKTEHSYNNFDYTAWTRRTKESCRHWADAFQRSGTEKAASSCFDRSGLRSSELLRLPYFDPTRHLVVDPMHNLFLGLLKEHFQNILGYIPPKSKQKGGNDPLAIPDIALHIYSTDVNPLPATPNAKRGARQLIRRLREPFRYDLSNPSQLKAAMEYMSSSTIQFPSMLYVAKGLDLVSKEVQSDGTLPNLPFAPALRKADLALLLVKWRSQQRSLPPYNPQIDRKYGRMFSEDEIHELWNDIENMIKPSWATSVPGNISSVCAKLKSDQWRAVGSLYLPVTLIRLWSISTPDDSDSQDRRQLLHLTMLLCSAISIITSRTISRRQAGSFLGYMVEYRKELQRLIPEYKCHPNHHMAMHLGEFLLMYGPVHGWWTFPFERMIGRLQRILTNYKPGEYEATIGRSWTRSSNFHALFSKASCPEAIKFCVKLFERLVKPDSRNTLGEAFDVPENGEDLESEATPSKSCPTNIPSDIYDALRVKSPHEVVPTSAIERGRLTIHGISYTRMNVHEGNSGILTFGSRVPYAIKNILEIPDCGNLEKYWFVVQRYQEARIERDPYAEYPHIRSAIWGLDLEDRLEVYPLSEIETHFAKCIIPWEGGEYAVITSLAKTHVVW